MTINMKGISITHTQQYMIFDFFENDMIFDLYECIYKNVHKIRLFMYVNKFINYYL